MDAYDQYLADIEYEDYLNGIRQEDAQKTPSFGAQANESIGQTALRAYKEIPEATIGFVKDAYNFATSPIDTIEQAGAEKTARTVGGLGAGVAGAAALAPLGLLGGPAAPVTVPLAGAIGGGLGLLGFDLATDAVSGEGGEDFKDKDQYVNDLVYNITQGGITGVVGSAAWNGAKGAVGKITKPFQNSTIESNVVSKLDQLEPNFAQQIDDATLQNAATPDPFFEQKSLAELLNNDAMRATERTIARSGADEYSRASTKLKQRASEQLKYLNEIEPSNATMADTQNSIGSILDEAENARTRELSSGESTVQSLLDQLPENIDPVEAGGLMREGASSGLDAQKAKVTAGFNGIGDGVIDPQAARLSAANDMPSYFKEVGAQPNSKLVDLIDSLNREAESSGVLGLDGKPITREVPYTIQDIQALRSEALNIAKGSDLRSARVAGNIAEALKTSVDDAIANGNISPEQAASWQKGIGERKTQGRIFESSATPTKSVLAKQPYGEFKLPESTIPSKYFKAGERGAKEAIRNYKEALGTSSEALDPLYRYASKSFRDYATNADGTLNTKKSRSWINNHASALSEMPELKQMLSNVDEAQTVLNEKFGEFKRTQAEVDKSALKQILEADPEIAITKMLSGSDPIRKTRATVEFLSKRDPDAVAGLRRGVIEQLKKVATQDERIKGQTLVDSIYRLKPLLRKSGLFSDAQVEGFETLYKEKRSELSVQNAKMGGSDTIPNATILSKLKDIGTSSFLGAMPGGRYLKFLEPVIRAIPQAKFNSILEEALLDPKMARQLARKVSTERMNRTVQSLFKEQINGAFGNNISTTSQIKTAAKRVAPLAPTITQETVTSNKSFPTPQEVYSPSEESLKKKSENMSKPDHTFDSKLDQISSNLGIQSEHLRKVIGFETGGSFDSAQKNRAGSGATGLIQFMPQTAQGLLGTETSTEAIKALENMSPTEQLDYVEKYLAPYKGRIKDINDLYMAVLYPRAIGKEHDYPLFKEGTIAYKQNQGLDVDRNGIVTKQEAASKVRSYKV